VLFALAWYGLRACASLLGVRVCASGGRATLREECCERRDEIAGVVRGSVCGEDCVLCRPGSDLLFRVLRLSTIGAGEFNGRVRDGIGFLLPARTTRPAKDGMKQAGLWQRWALSNEKAIKPIERLVPVSSTHYCAYTPGLSTWWSTTALKGELVSRWVSRLDAFSGYPVRT
jgi:hypothetical protein